MGSDPIQHIVLYAVKSLEDQANLVKLINSFKESAKRDGVSYILDVKCGVVKPVEPIRNDGFNVASVLTFSSNEDRKYFVAEDPAHKELITFAIPRLTKGVLVLDFVSGDATDMF